MKLNLANCNKITLQDITLFFCSPNAYYICQKDWQSAWKLGERLEILRRDCIKFGALKLFKELHFHIIIEGKRILTKDVGDP